MRKLLCTVESFIAICLLITPCFGQEIDEVLRNARSIFNPMEQQRLESYVVPITLETEGLEAIKALVEEKGFSEPRFVEYYKSPDHFAVRCVNEDYSPEVKGIVSGFLTPLIATYGMAQQPQPGQAEGLFEAKDRAKIAAGFQEVDGHPCRVIRLAMKDKGNNFPGLAKAVPTEKEITFWLDEESSLPRKIVFAAETEGKFFDDRQNVAVDKTETVTIKTQLGKVQGETVPIEILWRISDRDFLRVGFKYKITKGLILFSEKTISLSAESSEEESSTFRVIYGDYQINQPIPDDVFPVELQ